MMRCRWLRRHAPHVGPVQKVIVRFCAAFIVAFYITFVSVHRDSDLVEVAREVSSSTREVKDQGGRAKGNSTNAEWKEDLLSDKSHARTKEFGEDLLADALYDQVRILCWVLTCPEHLHKKAVHVRATWARRCNKVIFISSQDDPTFPAVKVPVHEGRGYLWHKTRGAFQYLYDHHLQDADWFLKADDDTYVVMENLRYLLASKSSEEPVYFGRRLKRYVDQGYMSGGAGYVLSRLALILAVEKGFPNFYLCRGAGPRKGYGAAEDLEMGRCLEAVGVDAGDSRDSLGRETFHLFHPITHIAPNGPECCSDYSISFHYISPNNMYLLEYMVYHMRPFGVGHYTCPANIDAILPNALPAIGQQGNAGAVPVDIAGAVDLKKNEVGGSQ